MSLIEKIDKRIEYYRGFHSDRFHAKADGLEQAREIILSEQKEPCKPKPLTIGDKIRIMNNNEIKDILVEFQLRGRYKKGMMSVSEIVDYLNQPYTED